MYKVLHVIGRMDRGGAETFIMNVLRNIDRSKYEFDFLLSSPNGDYIEEIKSYGCNIFVIPERNTGFIKYIKSLNNFFKCNIYDAVHMHVSSLTSIEALYFAKKHKIKNRIIHSHSTNQEGFLHKILHYFNKPIIKLVSTKFITCSKSAGEWLYSYTGINPNNVIHLNNGVIASRYLYNEDVRFEYRKIFGIDNSTILLSHIGRFDENKNQKFVVDVFKEYNLINPQSKLIFFGRGETENMVKKYVKDLNLEQNIIFAGVRPDIEKCLQALDFLIFPSHYEGLPVTLIEAQASGLYILASDKVSSEANLSKCFSSLSLEESAYEWSKFIINCEYPDRKEQNRYIIEKGYDILSTIKVLENDIYI